MGNSRSHVVASVSRAGFSRVDLRDILAMVNSGVQGQLEVAAKRLSFTARPPPAVITPGMPAHAVKAAKDAERVSFQAMLRSHVNGLMATATFDTSEFVDAPPTFDTFDTKTAITALYLWLLFGFLSSMVGCDVQKLMQQSKLVRHLLGVVSFFFLFTVLDSNNKVGLVDTLMKTAVVYMAFIMMIKSKWYFALPTLAVLVLDQGIKVHMDSLEKRKEAVPEGLAEARKKCTILLCALVVIGFSHYVWKQMEDHKDNFDWTLFLFGSICDANKPVFADKA